MFSTLRGRGNSKSKVSVIPRSEFADLTNNQLVRLWTDSVPILQDLNPRSVQAKDLIKFMRKVELEMAKRGLN